MKKLLKKIVLFMICAMMLFTAGACDTRNNPNNPDGNDPDNPIGGSTVTEKPVDTVDQRGGGNRDEEQDQGVRLNFHSIINTVIQVAKMHLKS